MEKGILYAIWYQDDTQTRKKELRFIEETNNFISFWNDKTEKCEIIPVNRIVRMEMMENGKNNNNSLY